MAFTLVSDRLWREAEPLLPPEPSKPKGGRPRVPNRACLAGIAYVLRTGMPWRFVPTELGCRSGVTCWHGLHEWMEAGAWPRVHEKLLDLLGRQGHRDRASGRCEGEYRPFLPKPSAPVSWIVRVPRLWSLCMTCIKRPELHLQTSNLLG